MSRKTQFDKAIDAIEDATIMLPKGRAVAIKALKQAKRDKDRLAHFCSPYYNLSVFGESVSEWRKAVDWSMKAMRQSK